MKVGDNGEPVEKKPRGEPTDIACPKCGKPMIKKTGKRGPFLACSGYPKCRSTMNVPPELAEKDSADPGKKKSAGKKSAAKKAKPETVDQACPECGAPMVKRRSRRGEFLGCSKYPKCKGTMSLSGEKSKTPAKKGPAPELTDIDCPTCGKKMVIRTGRYGKFLACSGYPKCKTTRKLAEDVKADEEEAEA